MLPIKILQQLNLNSIILNFQFIFYSFKFHPNYFMTKNT